MHMVPAWEQQFCHEVKESRDAEEASSLPRSPACGCWAFSGPACLPPILSLLE